MEKVGLFHFVAEPYLMDFRGRVTLPMIGNYLIHAASSHAGERGFGFNDMSERHTAWVLSRLAIEMKEYPTAFDKINLYTWIDEVGRLFTSRCFELADENGKTFGFARSIWAAIDVETYLIGNRGIGQIYRPASVPDREAGQDHAGGE